jgi:hypothetical protein
MTRSKRKSISDNRCPIKRSADCLSNFPPILRTPEQVGMTPEQMVTWRVSRGQQLYWCSECTCVWYRGEFNFLHVIGSQLTYGALFVPNKNKLDNIYIGS